jgi:hypothetical protein
MCTGSPDVPTIPERQQVKLPDGGDLTQRSADRRRRRMAYAAAIRTSPEGVLGQPATTAGASGASTLG